jgi:hypothetical protein
MILLAFIEGANNSPLATIKFDGRNFLLIRGKEKAKVRKISNVIRFYRENIDFASWIELIDKNKGEYAKRIYKDLGDIYADVPLVHFLKLCGF